MAKLFVKKLTNLDFSFLDSRRGLVGESWLLDIELSGMLNVQGMVLDFSIVKKLVRGYINQYIDHCLLVPVKYEGCDVLDKGEQEEIAFYLHNGQSIIHQSNRDAVAKIPAETINTETVTLFLLDQLKSLLPDNVSRLNIRLYTEPELKKNYQYSHGLRKHEGNCQRIAHGHRSKLKISLNGQRSKKWERYWLKKWRDIYLGTRRHIIDIKGPQTSYYLFGYTTSQGTFRLKLPKNKCYLIENETTIENIAQHLAEQIAEIETGKTVKVKAYEGIGKGAIAKKIPI
ncbi:MAG: hypothetical protein GY808_02035 [Gammaproteobacteria bacterium]|nr:hypothetical protein [Gammaproteobacteria bacterium]